MYAKILKPINSILLLFFLMFSLPVQAQIVEVTTIEWDLPTTREDGSTMPPGELMLSTIRCGKVGGEIKPLDVAVPGNSIKLADFGFIVDGLYTCSGTATNVYGAASDPSTYVAVMRNGGKWYKVRPAKIGLMRFK